MEKETYLGDGVYVSNVEAGIKLRAPREGGDHVIFLDADLMEALGKYLDKIIEEAECG